ncbi:glycoside hydrolase family 18 protein [Zasmidium cellare ATCC 36951]|uniref:chitinase n=1 Tax=Zasmidium cellare ATCC 36951 TaxID=1080233 RepID=A0A6A6BYB5_ZASCE|nr:glycoside hydrolase family 18 protein [Zasmidium cellare ATCC 36951]KAF2159058.1 glycoside hydrolase family 18 protein [Zasmidium cellare ATCC 36951]
MLGLYAGQQINQNDALSALGMFQGQISDQAARQAVQRLIPGNDISVKPTSSSSRSLSQREDTCKYIQAQLGDGCYLLAQRCGILRSDLESYYGGSSFCNTVQVNQYVCCSSGSPPDFSPKPTDGNCYVYTVETDDTCSSIATAHQEEVSAIESNNGQTWDWAGCAPPFPANVPNAVCGPQVNDTTLTSDPSSWSGLNPCPLNACCDTFGQCGITSDFCTAAPADTGAPGTAQPGSNGCISNCGTDVITSAAPTSFWRVGYYETFNYERPCLHMAPSDIPDYYTHVHWAFSDITSSYEVDVSAYQDIVNQFLLTAGFRRILSFGGWAFSTDPSTTPIFRQGHNLDGVDFDWEYPGAPNIPGIPPGSPEDGANYLAFLKLMRAALPSDYTISIAALASYYYLKAFPIAEISDIVDYIIYMTYDLHRQWDYGNTFTQSGCPAGNCLRSQMNMTETEQAFSMITKAGVPTNKLMMGQPLYGRSFQMLEAGCYTAMCTYTGPSSGATSGRCTQTGGYISNFEIQEILANDSNVQQYSSSVAGDILVYDDDQWISWMKQSTYDSRSDYAKGLNFGGTSDWAMDLSANYSGSGGGNSSDGGEGSGVVYIDPSIYSQSAPTIA